MQDEVSVDYVILISVHNMGLLYFLFWFFVVIGAFMLHWLV